MQFFVVSALLVLSNAAKAVAWEHQTSEHPAWNNINTGNRPVLWAAMVLHGRTTPALFRITFYG